MSSFDLDIIDIRVLHFIKGVDTKSVLSVLGIKNDRVGAVLLDMPGGDHLAHQLSRRLVGLRRLFGVGNARSEFCQLCKLDSGILLKELCLFRKAILFVLELETRIIDLEIEFV